MEIKYIVKVDEGADWFGKISERWEEKRGTGKDCGKSQIKLRDI